LLQEFIRFKQNKEILQVDVIRQEWKVVG